EHSLDGRAEPTLSQQLALHNGIRQSFTLSVTLGREVVAGDSQSGVIESNGGHHAGFAEYQHARADVGYNLQYDRRLDTLIAPVPVLRVNHVAFARRAR